MRRSALVFWIGLLGLAFAAPLTGCLQGSRQSLLEALEGYNDSVRWGRMSAAAAYLAPAAREAFVSRSDRLRDLQFTGSQVDGVRLQGDDRAFARVRFDWYSVAEGRLYQTVILQTWDKSGESWHVSEQRWLRGATLPLFAATAPRSPTRRR